MKRGISVLPENRPPFTKGNPLAQRGSRGSAVERSDNLIFMARKISLRRCPFLVFAQQLNVQLVQTASSTHIDGVVLDLLDRGDAGQRQQETEVAGKIPVVTGDDSTCNQLFGVQGLAVSGEYKLGFAFESAWAGAQRLERVPYGTGPACGHMNIAAQ